MAKVKTKTERMVRSKIYDLIYYESLKEDRPETPVTSAQLARLARGGAK